MIKKITWVLRKLYEAYKKCCKILPTPLQYIFVLFTIVYIYELLYCCFYFIKDFNHNMHVVKCLLIQNGFF